jgi:putative colanic acid biosynthesis UDP-glucose lipid carrier transferase
MDDAFAAVLLIPAAAIVACAALAIRAESPGPVLFRQTRVGRHGRRFRILKLRTLTRRAGGGQVMPGDPRLTRVGRWLRRSSLDELPQLLNVLRGEMSLVGPRPHALRDDLRFRRLQPGYDARRQVRPGLTGWAQVNGCRGAVRRADQLYRRTRHDLAYVAGRSLPWDLAILLRTAGAVVRGAGAGTPRD